MVSGLKSEHVFKMAAHVSSTSSEEMASSSEDSASEDLNNIAKGRGADLKEAEKAEIARTRKVQRNQAGGKKTVRGQKDPKVSAYQRVRENRNEFLSVTSKNMLRWDACKETISKKKSTVGKHINAVKHNDAKRAIHICYLPGGRSVWEKTVPEAVGLGPYSRPRAQFFPIRIDLAR